MVSFESAGYRSIEIDALYDDVLISILRQLGDGYQLRPKSCCNNTQPKPDKNWSMASPMQESIPEEIQPPAFIDSDGRLDMDRALREFQEFYRRNAEAWLERYLYKESAHHLLLMAFLQRVINAGGDIVREMAVGNGRIDLLVRYKDQEFALELKVLRDRHTIEDGLKQLDRYLDRLNLHHGYLIIFDPAPKDWEEKIYFRTTPHNQKTITHVGL